MTPVKGLYNPKGVMTHRLRIIDLKKNVLRILLSLVLTQSFSLFPQFGFAMCFWLLCRPDFVWSTYQAACRLC